MLCVMAVLIIPNGPGFVYFVNRNGHTQSYTEYRIFMILMAISRIIVTFISANDMNMNFTIIPTTFRMKFSCFVEGTPNNTEIPLHSIFNRHHFHI